ncbi:MAG: hypothetical protein ACREHG_02065 [Candidatus Saccharimonadales bacterium]
MRSYAQSGLIDLPLRFDTDHQLFTQGACHWLAKVINRITGWPIYAFWNDETEWDDHIFVRTPYGTFLDIDGEQTKAELLERWNAKSLGPFDVICEVPEDANFAAEGFDDFIDVEDSIMRAEAVAPGLIKKVVDNHG